MPRISLLQSKTSRRRYYEHRQGHIKTIVMKNKKEVSIDIVLITLTIDLSSLAEQANAAVLAKYGETVILATAVMGKKDVEMDYMPLKVDYEENFYAAGKIIGSRYMRREGRSS